MTASVVDWTVALATATRLVKPGPDISPEGAAEVVATDVLEGPLERARAREERERESQSA